MSIYGEYIVPLDQCGRFAMPKKLRATLPEMLLATIDIALPCIKVFSETAWENIEQHFIDHCTNMAYKRRWMRFMLGFMHQIHNDDNKIMLPPELCQKTKLNRHAHIITKPHHLEIWNPQIYERHLNTIDIRPVKAGDQYAL
ncbi:MAG: division/cell wall cluster transcriptional repressor MraZ [Cellvibrionaceae bacterium]